MGETWFAETIVGVPLDTAKLTDSRETAEKYFTCDCAVAKPPDAASCPGCGEEPEAELVEAVRDAFHRDLAGIAVDQDEWPHINANDLENRKLLGHSLYLPPLGDEESGARDRPVYICLSMEMAEGSRARCRRTFIQVDEFDKQQMKRDLKPHGLWDEDAFGVYTFISQY